MIRIPIYFTLLIAFLSFSVPFAKRPTASDNSSVSDSQQKQGRTYRYRKNVNHIEINMYIIIQIIHFFLDFDITS